jgi:hypothetical protein
MRKISAKGATGNMKIVEIFADDTHESRQALEDGLRILARIIAGAILADTSAHKQTKGQIDAESGKLYNEQ